MKIESNKLFYNDCLSKLDTHGFYCIENAISDDDLNILQSHINYLVSIHGNKYFSLTNPYLDTGSPFSKIVGDTSFIELLKKLAELKSGLLLNNSKILNILRVVTGSLTKSQSNLYHFDASLVTALVPIIIPNEGALNSGNLVAFPNIRPLRKSVLINIFEKILYQNPITRFILSLYIKKFSNGKHVITLKPGNIYLFWGYQTLHANLENAPNNLRATLLLHYGNPYDNSILMQYIFKFNRFKDFLRLKHLK